MLPETAHIFLPMVLTFAEKHQRLPMVRNVILRPLPENWKIKNLIFSTLMIPDFFLLSAA